MAGIPAQQVAMRVRRGALSAFLPLLQGGVRVACRAGVTLEELLVGQWGIEAAYVSRRITTLFVNSRAIDSVATTVVPGGAVVALSGAMPGLVGATMRAGGFYAAMRGAMTYREDAAPSGSDNDWVRLKLFNLLLAELGPGFLFRGIIVTAAELATLLATAFAAADFSTFPSLNGRDCSPAALAGELARLGSEDLLLTVRFEDNS